MSVRVIVLAAGQGTRMKSSLAKVLHPVAGAPLVDWVVKAVLGVGPDETLVVIGHGGEDVAAVLPAEVGTVVQEEQNGTGHAVLVALEALGDVEGDTVVVVPGDTPLITSATLAGLVEAHAAAEPSVTMLTTHLTDPTGYGRIVRDDAGEVVGIVEERDADEQQRRIDEVAVSMYAFAGGELVRALNQVGTANNQGEMYLTDVIEILAAEGAPIAAVAAPAPEVSGVNSHDQLAAVGKLLRARLNEHWMQEGVSMLDPERVYLDSTVELAAGVVLMPDVYLHGSPRFWPEPRSGRRSLPKTAGSVGTPGSGIRCCGAPKSESRPRSGRSPACGPALCWGRRPKPGPSSKPRTRRCSGGARSRISATWEMPRSAKTPTSEQAPSPATTTASRSTAPPSVIGCESVPTRCWWPRS